MGSVLALLYLVGVFALMDGSGPATGICGGGSGWAAHQGYGFMLFNLLVVGGGWLL